MQMILPFTKNHLRLLRFYYMFISANKNNMEIRSKLKTVC